MIEVLAVGLPELGASEGPPTGGREYTPEEQAAVAERLRALGYLE